MHDYFFHLPIVSTKPIDQEAFQPPTTYRYIVPVQNCQSQAFTMQPELVLT